MTELGQSAAWVGDEQAEIDKIMSEIEQLEKEMQSNGHSSSPESEDSEGSNGFSSPALSHGFAAHSAAVSAAQDEGDVSLEDTLAQLPIEETSFASDLQTTSSSDPSSTVSMTLSGPMIFRFMLESTHQEVTFGFGEQFLQIELPDGSELKIPLKNKKTLRKVA